MLNELGPPRWAYLYIKYIKKRLAANMYENDTILTLNSESHKKSAICIFITKQDALSDISLTGQGPLMTS